MTKVILEIPDEEIKEQLKENTYVVEGEGEKGSVDVAMLYTNGILDFTCVEGREHFVRLKYKTLPDNATNGDMIKAMFPQAIFTDSMVEGYVCNIECHLIGRDTKTMYFDTDWWNAPYEGGTT